MSLSSVSFPPSFVILEKNVTFTAKTLSDTSKQIICWSDQPENDSSENDWTLPPWGVKTFDWNPLWNRGNTKKLDVSANHLLPYVI